MRIISGKYRGKKLLAPNNDFVRPTTDRVKETIFNILCNYIDIESSCCLDLFCGSGALGIECISRYAAKVVFVDKDTDSYKLTKANLAAINSKSQVFNVTYDLALKKVSDSFDIIFVDPPYEAKLESNVLHLIEKYERLNRGGVIVIEHSRDNVISYDETIYNIDRRMLGSTAVDFVRLREKCGSVVAITGDSADEIMVGSVVAITGDSADEENS